MNFWNPASMVLAVIAKRSKTYDTSLNNVLLKQLIYEGMFDIVWNEFIKINTTLNNPKASFFNIVHLLNALDHVM
jgi:hypothetical protein